MTKRVVAIGDLNAADDALIDILRGTKLVDKRLHWSGGRAELVQLGDLFNRGGGALRALKLLLRLEREAKHAGGKVTVLLGNHEAMTALRHEGYCTEDEYLAFASPAARRKWPEQVQRAFKRLLKSRSLGVVRPLEPRLEAWKIEHVPGQKELRRELGPRGVLGRALRQLPLAYALDGSLFVHAGILPEWAELGVDGLNRAAADTWRAAGSRPIWKLPKHSLFRDPRGPLWDRSLVRGGNEAKKQLRQSLALLGAERMIVGHTPTSALDGGRRGRIQVLAGGQLVAIDVGLGSGDTPRAALIIDGKNGFEWTPERITKLWSARGVKRR